MDKLLETLKKENNPVKFRNHIQNYPSSALRQQLKENKSNFLDFYKHLSQRPFRTHKYQNPLVDALRSRGIVKIEKLYSREELQEIKNWSDYFLGALKSSASPEHVDFIGPVDLNQGGTHVQMFGNYPDGQTRISSKMWSFNDDGQPNSLNGNPIKWNKAINPFNSLALTPITKSKFLNKIFHDIGATPKTVLKPNLEILLPAEYNHNGWHIDMVRDEIKVMVLLSEVTPDCGPMHYAVSSNGVDNSLEQVVKYALFSSETSEPGAVSGIRSPKIKTTTNNLARHRGYLADCFADNYSQADSSNPITLGEQEYEVQEATGSFGDAYIFFSNGFHSGNICKKRERQTLTLSVNCQKDNLTKWNALLDELKVNC